MPNPLFPSQPDFGDDRFDDDHPLEDNFDDDEDWCDDCGHPYSDCTCNDPDDPLDDDDDLDDCTCSDCGCDWDDCNCPLTDEDD